MIRFWENPELVRHLRAELRPARVLFLVASTYVVIAFAAMAIFGGAGATEQAQREARLLFFATVAAAAASLLVLWCLMTGARAVAGERELRTFDFLRTTRLTAGELLVGKLFGAPVLPWIVYACAVPVMVLSGLSAGIHLDTIALMVALVAALAILIGLVGIWVSMLQEKTGRGVVVLGVLLLYPLATMGLIPELGGPLPGMTCLSPLAAVVFAVRSDLGLHLGTNGTVPVFGDPVPYAAVTLALYASMGAWLVLMIVRNFKRDVDEIRLLSRRQAIGFALYVQVLFYALLNRHEASGRAVQLMASALTGLTAALVGLATLSPPHRLKMWVRQRAAGAAGYLSEDGLPWPWMLVAAAAGLAMLAFENAVVRPHDRALPVPPTVALTMLFVLVFAVRDVLLLQWCKLTRMKKPVSMGIVLLALYYFAAGMVLIAVFAQSEKAGMFTARVLTPMFAWRESERAAATSGMVMGLLVQGGVVAVLLVGIAARLRRTAAVGSA